MSVTWSYSSLKTFEQCPKKYYHLKVIKDTKDSGSEATIYGQEVHKAAEEFVRDGVPIPEKFAFMRELTEAIRQIPGEKHCELKLGVRKTGTGYKPCGFFDKDVWWRGICDVVVVNGELAYSIDYKTSKNTRYADMKQLDVVAAALFTNFPQIKRIKSGLVFVVCNEFLKKEHYVEDRDKYFDAFTPSLDRLSVAQETDVWNANSGPLCKFCPVVTCEHNRKR